MGQLEGTDRDFQSNCWVNLRILGQPCKLYPCEPAPGELLGRCWTKGDTRLLEDLTRASGAVALPCRESAISVILYFSNQFCIVTKYPAVPTYVPTDLSSYSTVQPSVQEYDSVRSSDRGERPWGGATRACSRTALSALALADPFWRCQSRESVPERESGLTRGPMAMAQTRTGTPSRRPWPRRICRPAARQRTAGCPRRGPRRHCDTMFRCNSHALILRCLA